MNIVAKSLVVSFVILTWALPTIAASPGKISAARHAVKRAMPLILKSAVSYVQQKDCFTCHHQALPVMAAASSKQLGMSIEAEWFETQRKFTADFFLGRKKELAKGQGVPGGAFTAGYALAQFISTTQTAIPADENQVERLPGTDELLDYLLTIYQADRPWKINTIRPPLESSDFTATGLAIAAIGTYEPVELIKRTRAIRQWFVNTKAVSTEDRAFQLLGWYWLINTQYAYQAKRLQLTDPKPANLQVENPDTDADASVLQEMLSTLRNQQREDGGWGQTEEMTSDAYATGLVLTAVLTVNPELFEQKWVTEGVQYLLKNQLKDGSWLVLTRSKPIQEYFESEFPHGEDQFISISASCWSVIALSQYAQQGLKQPD